MSEYTKIKIIGDAIEYEGEPVARITKSTSTIRDAFEDTLLNHTAAPLSSFAQMAQNIRARAKTTAVANAITLTELDAILDLAMGL